jgi:hypothetical protein
MPEFSYPRCQPFLLFRFIDEPFYLVEGYPVQYPRFSASSRSSRSAADSKLQAEMAGSSWNQNAYTLAGSSSVADGASKTSIAARQHDPSYVLPTRVGMVARVRVVAYS